ncbi:polyamine aminopropyltransferase [Atribacter laminatus]|jgi:spermidine synthase|uniref:Polyamine aminopropyltransferase n=1 Tax=Atribacter laminatus TaxID=2847778 RepID=A0A7T1AMT2_ATRLM|nr:polyamine aminopropyltransferase [Atribacter laminatus]QPM68801.1 Polyamine aminopropyltransferase [Atribacter laminatus]
MALWYYEDYIPHYRLGLEIKETLFLGNSLYQKIQVVDSYLYGKVLLLDDIVQTTEKDEFMYHEMLIHPALLTHPQPKKILIVGGGDGGASREVLKHPVKKVKLVDIDSAVIEISRKFLPELGNWNDQRLEVLVEDAVKYLALSEEIFDVIVMDSTDPLPSGVAEPLFSKEFFQSVYDHLSEDGVLVSQIEPPFFQPEREQRHWESLNMFPLVKVYWGLVPTYPGGIWTYMIASKGKDPAASFKKLSFPTRYYTPEIHRAAFALPPFMQERLSKKP